MANLNKENIPKHVAIIMDGNGRWAIENSFKISEGHKKGVITVKDIVEESVKQQLSSLTIYAFSSENWKRPRAEINACLLYTSPSPRDLVLSRMPSSA